MGLVVRLLIVLAVSFVVAPQLSQIVLAVIVLSTGICISQSLARYSVTLPLVLILALSAFSGLVGISRVATLTTLLVISLALTVVNLRRVNLCEIALIGRTSEFLIYIIPVSSWALARVVEARRAFAWALSGDAGTFVQYQMIVRNVSDSELVSFAAQARTVGLALVGSVFAEGNLLPVSSSLANEVTVAVSIAIVSLILAVTQLVRAVDPEPSLLVGLVLGIFIPSGLALGLVASNGFLSVGLTLALFVLCASSLSTFWREGSGSNLVVALVALVALAVTWVFIAAALAGILVVVLYGRLSKRNTGNISWLLIGVFVGVYLLGWAASGPLSSFWSGYFPATPLAIFALSTGFALAFARGSVSNLVLVLVATAIAGSVAMFIVASPSQVANFISGVFLTNSSEYYYVRKYIWLSFFPIATIVLVLVARQKYFNVPRSNQFVAIAAVVGAGYLAAPTPNVPWLSPATTPESLALGEVVTRSVTDNQGILFHDYASPTVDSRLNYLFSLNWNLHDPLILPAFDSWGEACEFFFLRLPEDRTFVSNASPKGQDMPDACQETRKSVSQDD